MGTFTRAYQAGKTKIPAVGLGYVHLLPTWVWISRSSSFAPHISLLSGYSITWRIQYLAE